MFKILSIWLSVYLQILSNLGERKSTNAITTLTSTSKPLLQFLDRFHQSDYKVSYEWTEAVRVNKDFMDFKTIAFKYNRTITAKNFTMLVKVNMEYDIDAYKFASNEYRVFPMRFQLNICSAMNKAIAGSEKFSQNGSNFSCPLKKGKRYVLVNWTPNELNLAPFIPNGKYMVELQYIFHSTEVLVTRDYATIFRPMVIY